MSELRDAVTDMKSRTAPGVFGLDTKVLKLLLANDYLASEFTSHVNAWLADPYDEQVLRTLLTAIPKANKPTNSPSNLRPISVTSSLYRLCMRVLVARIRPALTSVFSPDQHGFCPGRSVCTALYSVLPLLDRAKHTNSPLYLLTVDVDKAYDSVCRARLFELCTYMGIADCALFRLMWYATTAGGIHVTG